MLTSPVASLLLLTLLLRVEPSYMSSPTTCPYCQLSLGSRNQFYTHLRTTPCGDRATADGFDLDKGRPKRQPKMAILFGYGQPGAHAAEALLRASLHELDGRSPLTTTRAMDVSYRHSPLLRHEDLPAVEDVVVVRPADGACASKLSFKAQSQWLAGLNARLRPGGAIVHGLAVVHPDLQSLNAEQHCSAREHVCLLPWGLLADEPPADDAAALRLAEALKPILRSLQPPKSATSGGFRGRRSAVQVEWREKHRWHNFAEGTSLQGHRTEGDEAVAEATRGSGRQANGQANVAVPNDAAVRRVVDRFWLRGSPLIWRCADGSPFVRFHVSADALLDGQLERMVGIAVCVWRGWLPPSFPSLALDPSIVTDTPAVPRGLCYLRRARFDWEAPKQPIFRRRRSAAVEASLHNFESALMETIAASDAASDVTTRAWLELTVARTCPSILANAERLGLGGRLSCSVDGRWAEVGAATVRPAANGAEARVESSQVKVSRVESSRVKTAVRSAVHGAEARLRSKLEVGAQQAPQQAPPEYAEVLRLLREADSSGHWPRTSRARAKILHVADPAHGGSFSLRAPGHEAAATWHEGSTRGNALFDELVRAVFELEIAIAPNRPPSSMVAVNRRATFLPHVDTGSGFGQSSSLIVGLGAYSGGELVVEGEPSDIRYRPLTFDGWRQRHWTLPFEGERFSLVWFTPMD